MSAFWKEHYVVDGDADAIELSLKRWPFTSGTERFELLAFERQRKAPCILVSQGSGGHGYVFAQLGHQLFKRGFNVFIMPKHGGHTVPELMSRHRDALGAITNAFNASVGVYAEGLGGYIAFYVALAAGPMRSLICENAPAILNDPQYHRALLSDSGPWSGAVRRRRVLMPLARPLARVWPGLRLPISSYLDWEAMIDTRFPAERRLVQEGYLRDPEFDRWYPVSHVASLVSEPPPGRLEDLHLPVMFLLAKDGPTPGYVRELYGHLPGPTKRLVEIDGGVYWMLSHPQEAADLICGWFKETLSPETRRN